MLQYTCRRGLDAHSMRRTLRMLPGFLSDNRLAELSLPSADGFCQA